VQEDAAEQLARMGLTGPTARVHSHCPGHVQSLDNPGAPCPNCPLVGVEVARASGWDAPVPAEEPAPRHADHRELLERVDQSAWDGDARVNNE